jgi:hypothetical protein
MAGGPHIPWHISAFVWQMWGLCQWPVAMRESRLAGRHKKAQRFKAGNALQESLESPGDGVLQTLQTTNNREAGVPILPGCGF